MRALIYSLVFSSTLLAQTAERFPGYRVYQDMLLQPDSAIISGTARLWTNNTVPYIIDSDIPNPTRINDAITWYNQNTPVKYQPRAAEANYVHYVRSTIGDGVCYSSVGMVGGEQFIHVEDACNTGTLIHEMTHTTGFYHEQERQDRNQNITVLYENIDKAQFGEFPVAGSNGQDAGGYEYASHMHYGSFSFSRTGLPVIQTVPAGLTLDPYTVLSPGDLDTLFRMYGQPPAKTTVVTNPPGLQMTVDGSVVTSPQVYDWPPGTTHSIAVSTQNNSNGRFTFGKWSDGGAASHTITSSPDVTLYTANLIQEVQVNTSVTPAAGGSISINSASPDGYFTRQTTLVLTAAPGAGYTFLRWVNGNGSFSCPFIDSQNPLTINTAGTNISCVATFTQSPMTTIATDPPGLPVTVDGTTFAAAPVSMAWAPNSNHTISTASPLSTAVSPTRHIFLGWSDGKAASHSVTAGSSSATITASFKTQYLLVVPVFQASVATFTINPPSADGFYDAGTKVQITAVAGSGWSFSQWSRDLFGQPNPGTLTMNSQMAFGATLFQRPPALTVVNGANFMQAAVSPGELITIFGAGLGPPQLAGAVLDANSRFPTTLAGTTVMFGNVAAPIVYTSSNQVAALAPYALANNTSGTTALSVMYNGKVIAGPSLSVANSAPGIFTLNSSGVGPAVITNQDGTINSPDHPAPKGSIIVLYATGEGQISPGGVDGAITGTPLPSLTLPVSLRIGGKPAQLMYAGEAPNEVSGVMQINAVVPPDAPSGTVSVYLVVGNNISPLNVTMNVQ